MAMPSRAARVYGFGDFRLDPGRRLLIGRDGAPVSLKPKTYDTLAYLVERAGTVVHKDELMQAIWPDTVVEENSLTQNIALVRRALGEGRSEHRYIATVPGRGYQFVAGVKEVAFRAENAETGAASIAVLPFVNVSSEPDCEYFGDGLADDLINALSKMGRVRVVARTSAFSFKGKQADVREIAGQLGVNLVLEGSVRKVGNRLRITAQLVDAADGCQLWSERYDREAEAGDLFAVQDEITPAVVDALKVKLPSPEGSALRKRSTQNVKAHELYLKGRFHSFRFTSTGIEAGIPCFERAIESAPSYALAQVGLAHAYRSFGLTLDMPTSVVGPKAKAAALKAVEMDDNLAEGHAVLGSILFLYERDWSAAEKHLKRALELDPNSADAHWIFAHLRSNTGRHGEALAEIARARELDPLSCLINAMEGQFLLHADRIDEAIARLQEAIDLDPKSRAAHMFAASAYIEKGRFAEAIAEARAGRALSPSNTECLALESYANARAGARAEAREALETCLQLSRHRYVPPCNVAMIYTGLSEPGEALAWLERGFDDRDPRMTFLKVQPRWKELREDSRFIGLLRRIGLGS